MNKFAQALVDVTAVLTIEEVIDLIPAEGRPEVMRLDYRLRKLALLKDADGKTAYVIDLEGGRGKEYGAMLKCVDGIEFKVGEYVALGEVYEVRIPRFALVAAHPHWLPSGTWLPQSGYWRYGEKMFWMSVVRGMKEMGVSRLFTGRKALHGGDGMPERYWGWDILKHKVDFEGYVRPLSLEQILQEGGATPALVKFLVLQ